MKVMDILSCAKKILGYEAEFDNQYTAEAASVKNRRLLTAFNVAMSEIAADFFPFIARETKKGKTIYFAEFEKPFYDVIKAEENGREIEFIRYSDKIELPQTGTYEITYRYILPQLNESDSVDLDPKLTMRILALATASRYAELNGLYEESVVYSDQFEKSIAIAARKNNIRNFTMRLKERWIR